MNTREKNPNGKSNEMTYTCNKTERKRIKLLLIKVFVYVAVCGIAHEQFNLMTHCIWIVLLAAFDKMVIYRWINCYCRHTFLGESFSRTHTHTHTLTHTHSHTTILWCIIFLNRVRTFAWKQKKINIEWVKWEIESQFKWNWLDCLEKRKNRFIRTKHWTIRLLWLWLNEPYVSLFTVFTQPSCFTRFDTVLFDFITIYSRFLPAIKYGKIQ